MSCMVYIPARSNGAVIHCIYLITLSILSIFGMFYTRDRATPSRKQETKVPQHQSD